MFVIVFLIDVQIQSRLSNNPVIVQRKIRLYWYCIKEFVVTCSCRSLVISSLALCSSSRLCSSSIIDLRASFSLASRSYSCRSRARRSVESSKASTTVEEWMPSKECREAVWWKQQEQQWVTQGGVVQPLSRELTHSATASTVRQFNSSCWHFMFLCYEQREGHETAVTITRTFSCIGHIS